jgi:anti-sigma B factor antagonist
MSPDPQQAATTGLRLETQHKEDATVIKCTGKLTLEHAEALKSLGKTLIPQSKRLVVDLKEVTRMDSAGLGAVVGLYVSTKKAKCDFLLINYSNSIKDLLGMTHLLSVFESCAQSGMRFS